MEKLQVFIGLFVVLSLFLKFKLLFALTLFASLKHADSGDIFFRCSTASDSAFPESAIEI